MARYGSTAREYKVGAMARTAKLIENIYLYSQNIGKSNISNEVAPIFLIFFQQWNYNLIKTYDNKNLFNSMVIEQIEAEKMNTLKEQKKLL